MRTVHDSSATRPAPYREGKRLSEIIRPDRRRQKVFALVLGSSVEKFDALLGAGGWTRHTVPNEQRLDREALISRLLSSSYSPREGEPGHDETITELRALFDRHAEAGAVTLLYSTVVIVGRAACLADPEGQ